MWSALLLAVVPASASLLHADSDEPEREGGIIARISERRLAWVEATDQWLLLGPTATYSTVQDTRMSPLIYALGGGGAHLGRRVEREPWVLQTLWRGHYAIAGLPNEITGFYQGASAEFDAALLRRVGSGFNIGAGVRVGTNIRIYDRLQNGSFNADVAGSINGVFGWDTALGSGSRALILDAIVSAPLSTVIARTPEYSFNGVDVRYAAPWQFVRATLLVGLGWRMRWSEENRFKVWYRWDLYGTNEFDGLHLLRVATHSLGFSLAVRRM